MSAAGNGSDADDRRFEETFSRLYRPALALGAGLLLVAGAWAVISMPVENAAFVVAAVAWAAALTAVGFVVTGSRAPTDAVAVAALTVALLGSGVAFGLLRRAGSGIPAVLAAGIFFLVVVCATVLRAEVPRAQRPSAFD